jgi:amidase
LRVERHHVFADKIAFALDANSEPRITLPAPVELIIETLDARGGRLQRPEDVEGTAPDYRERFPKTNPATGPIAIDGAEPGDVLTAEILDIELGDRGYTLVKPGFGLIPDMVERPIARICSIKNGILYFGNFRLPVRPMIGLIATAPEGEPQGTAFVGRYGGNLDCNLITIGAKVHLPVRVSGGLFFVGDVHAMMGDGEISGSGMEIDARIHLRLTLTKGGALDWPWLETESLIATLACASTFDEASVIVARSMLHLLVERHGISQSDAYMLMSIRGDLRVNQACQSPVDVSVRLEIPRILW